MLSALLSPSTDRPPVTALTSGMWPILWPQGLGGLVTCMLTLGPGPQVKRKQLPCGVPAQAGPSGRIMSHATHGGCVKPLSPIVIKSLI